MVKIARSSYATSSIHPGQFPAWISLCKRFSNVTETFGETCTNSPEELQLKIPIFQVIQAGCSRLT